MENAVTTTDNVAQEREGSGRRGRARRRARRKARREQAALARRAALPSPPAESASAFKSFDLLGLLRQADEVLKGVERAARELRNVAQSAVSAVEIGKDQLARQREALEAWRGRGARLHKTGSMLAQLVLRYRLFEVRTAFASPERSNELLAQLHAENAERFADVSRDQGGAFLKVGQLLSTRADLLPAIWVRELSSLQDAAPPIPREEAMLALREALGAEPESCFEAFEPEPIAAASIGQVHRARTREGIDVAVKLQRPNIASCIEDDLALLELSCEALRGSLPALSVDTVVAQIRQHVRAELDYLREAQLTARAAAFFADAQGVIVPAPIPALCSPQLLTTRFIEGRKITRVLDELSAARADGDGSAQARISHLLGLLLQAYLRQMFELGTFQADPHPGNLLVTPQGELVILDFGCASELSDATRYAYLDLMLAFFARDHAALTQAFDALGFRTESGRPDTLIGFMDAVLGELAEAMQQGRVSWPDRSAVAARAKALGRSLTGDPVTTLPDHFVMIGRVLATLSGLFAHYHPDIDVPLHVLPVFSRCALLRETPKSA